MSLPVTFNSGCGRLAQLGMGGPKLSCIRLPAMQLCTTMCKRIDSTLSSSWGKTLGVQSAPSLTPTHASSDPCPTGKDSAFSHHGHVFSRAEWNVHDATLVFLPSLKGDFHKVLRRRTEGQSRCSTELSWEVVCHMQS